MGKKELAEVSKMADDIIETMESAGEEIERLNVALASALARAEKLQSEIADRDRTIGELIAERDAAVRDSWTQGTRADEAEELRRSVHARVLVAALERGDQATAELDETKKGYTSLDSNWHTLHEAFTSAIRKALELPNAEIRELVERIDDLKAAERAAPRLHVFHNDCDWVVAYSVDDAWTVLTGTTGEERDERGGFDEMVQLPDDQILPICMHTDVRGPDITGLEVEELGEKEHFQIRVKTTCGDWCRRNGRGFLCSTEF